MKGVSLFKWFKNISIAKKLYLTVGLMATLIAIELGALVFSINTLSSVRAYVSGEGLWSKAQKDAMYQLLKYSRSHDEADYQKFKEFMKVPGGDHKTLVELGKENPDMEIARQGFIEGRNHKDDVEGMINLFTRFNSISYINKAIKIWSQADPLVAEFIPIGEQLHKEINSPHPSHEKINEIVQAIDPLNARLTILEDDFSYTLGEGSRWLENLVLKLLFAIALTVEITGLTLAIIVSRNIQKGLNEILQSAKAVAKNDFSRKAKAFSKDEIGILANNFNNMADELDRSIRDIEQAQQKFKGLLESAPDAIVIVGEKGIIQLVNKQCENVFGYGRNELIGCNVELLLPERFRTSQTENQKLFYDNPGIRSTGAGIELLGRRKNGEEFPVEISLSPLETEEGILITAAIRDISEKKRLEKEIREANVTLEKKVKQRTAELESKNKELAQFAYVASHDLQEPLRTTSSFVELLRKQYHGKIDDNANRYIDYVIQASDRMKTLIKDLLDYSRIGREKKIEPVDCNVAFSEVIADLAKVIKENKAEITAGDLPVINAFPTELKLLFQNLISNSIKFQKPGIAPHIEISTVRENGYWHFQFRDNGIGIEKQYQERIFIIFQRLHNRSVYEGSGIGLAHCKKIVELHGGTIWVQSEAGKGSTFHFTLAD
ncbi:PAS domain S-box protein [Niastella caeni]|uniref:histidine kinase n=1 Tax=Niastella caeni TaxID=2569763 RepID=A0A4S8I001_9BACT|nr:ATP-binding protein [Niastella caeni]THU41393.1 PAS domain S-box protein [Niastella caeni]